MGERWADSVCGIQGVGHQVAIRVADPRARAAVASRFSAMIERLDGEPRGYLDLEHTGGTWRAGGGANVVEGSLETALCYLRYQVTHTLMAARPDLLWLHAAAAARNGRAVLIVGPSGSGKSSLAARLVRRGFRYLGDEVIPLDPRDGVVHPFPLTPAIRKETPQVVAPAEVRRLEKIDLPLDPSQVAGNPSPVHTLVFPVFAPGMEGCRSLPPAVSALQLACHCLDFTSDHERGLRALARLASRSRAARLSFGDIGYAAAQTERLHTAEPVAVA